MSCSPKAAATLCTCTRVETAVAKLKKNARGSSRARSGKVIGGGSGGGGGGSFAGDLDGLRGDGDADSPGGIEMMNNPFMAARGPGSHGDTFSAAFSVKELEAMNDMPDRPTWFALRASYILSLQTSDALTKQVQQLTKALATGASGVGDDAALAGATTAAAAGLLSASRARHTFGPVQLHGSSSGSGSSRGGDDAGSPRDDGGAVAMAAFRRSASSRGSSSPALSMSALKKKTSVRSAAPAGTEDGEEA